jgi:PHD/YefM family antitoxin component YafN of YafNO toxin-antitoxin module
MKIPKNAIVSNSDIIKNYKTQRERAENIGKLFVFKNNQPDAVLFSMSEFEKVAELLELIETMSEAEINNILEMVKDHKKKISFAL